MKKALLFCCSLLLCAAQLLAAPAAATFVSERGVPFQLRLDGQRLSPGMTREVFVDRMTPGFHWAEFRIPAGRGFVEYRTRVLLDAGFETNFLLLARRGYAPVLRKVSQVPLRRDRGPRYDDRHDRDWDNDRDGRYDDRQDCDDDRRPDYDPRYDRNDRDDRTGGYDTPRGGNYRQPMRPAEVDELMRAVDAKSFDNGKLAIAKDALAQSLIRTEDLKRLLQRFDFESQRLEMAKYGYDHLADPQNFYRVYELFNFDSNVKELQQYAAQTRQNDDYRPGYEDRRRSVMTPTEVDDLVQAANRKVADRDKLSILQDGLARASIRTEDLKRMLRVFSFEDQRLALAKFAYRHVTDPQNFSQVYTLFNFSSNVEALREYVSQQPRP